MKKDVYNAKIKDIEDKIPDITNLGTTVTPNAKINEVKNEIPSITNLATTTALTAVGNKISSVSDLVKKADYHAEIKDIENKYFTTSDFNEFTNNVLDAKITAKQIVNESGLNGKIKALAIKVEIKKSQQKQDKTVKLQTYDFY